MWRLNAYVRKHLEAIIVISVLVGSALGVFFIVEKSVLLNFFYLPVLITGYFLGRKHAVLAGIFCVLALTFYCILYPDLFCLTGKGAVSLVTMLLAWAGFLMLVAIISSHLFEVNQQRIRELHQAYVGVLEILMKFLESKDPYTKGHSTRVAELAIETARAMKLTEEEIETIRVAALLHDIGKVDISTAVIHKAASLTSEERKEMNTHTEKGADILKSIGGVLKGAVPLIVAHHEYFAHDEKSGELPLGARIISVADAFDSMVTDRPYRKAMPLWEAIAELKKNAGRQFDPKVVAAFEHVAAARVEHV
jgi:putative nucleotidyltransferase with HDIG domain